MEKFLTSKKRPHCDILSRGNGDVKATTHWRHEAEALSAISRKPDLNRIPQNDNQQISSEYTPKDQWQQRTQSTFTSTELSIASKNSNSIANKSQLQGWKVQDGRKVFKTFRNGKLIQAAGQDAYILSLGGQNKKKTEGESVRESQKNK